MHPDLPPEDLFFWGFSFLNRRRRGSRRGSVLAIIVGLGWVLMLTTIGQASARVTHLRVDDRTIGVSSRYIGACEGNVRFDIADLVDLGINTYRIYGGMSRWEPTDDDGAYGLPTIAQIKQNPDRIPWEKWDQIMGEPSSGSDYAFSGQPAELWQGSAQTIFQTLKQAQIRPVLTIRNTDPSWGPDWALELNPPRTAADWNEWWEHVFATVYWLNVRHDYGVDDFEIHNEPDNRSQGWGGNQADYFKLVAVAADAIEHVYAKYLPDRRFHLHGPTTTGGSHWPQAMLAKRPQRLDTMNVHDYDWNISAYVRQVRGWMRRTSMARSPLWLGEWGTYTQGDDKGYDDLNFSLNLIKNLIRMSQPGDTAVVGSHIFSLYDWGRDGSVAGLVNARGDRRLAYYALRLGIRALQGGRSVLRHTGGNSAAQSAIMAIVTQVPDEPHQFYLLMVNDQANSQSVMVDLSALLNEGTGTIWEFSATAKDEIVGKIAIMQGKTLVELPAQTGRLVVLSNQHRSR